MNLVLQNQTKKIFLLTTLESVCMTNEKKFGMFLKKVFSGFLRNSSFS